MKLLSNFHAKAFLLLSFVFATSLAMPSASVAAPVTASVDLAKSPLADSTLSKVLPNIMFILDDSGSMDWNYLPDWVNDSLCKNSSGAYSANCDKQPPFRSPDFNSIYYNPAITYNPPVDADKVSRASQTSWTSVKNDAYNIQSTSSTNLVTSYPDVVWCVGSSTTDCLRNDNYILPGTVNGKAYTTSRTGQFATGSGLVATGNLASPTTVTRSFGPHYYKITPGEFCDTAQLTNCQTTETATFKYPAKIRWCKATAATTVPVAPARTAEQNATSGSPAARVCQATRINGTYDAIRYPTKFFVPAVAAVAPTPYIPAIPPTPYIPAVLPTPYKPAVPATLYSPAVAAVIGVRPTGLITFSGGNTSNSSGASARINDDLSGGGSDSVKVNGNQVFNNSITIGRNRTPTQAAAAVVAAIGTAGSVKAYVGGNSITPTCASKTNTVVCLVVTTTYTNSQSVAVGSFNGDAGTLTKSTTSTAGGVVPVAGSAEVLATPGSPEVLATPGSPEVLATLGSPEVLATPGSPAQPAQYPGSFTRVDIVTGQTYTKVDGASSRTDCGTGATCTYAQEMTNFANWWTYYQTRMQSMKTAVSLAFKNIGERYRVGYTTIGDKGATDNSTFQHINVFDSTQKSTWYTKLFNANPDGRTPLRGALSKAGRIYGNKISGQKDPIQYSCQQNFTILSTDGYWNTTDEDGTYGPYGLTGAAVGNKDGGTIDLDATDGVTTTREMLDTFNKADTLADVAKYYYDTDLRTVALGNCTGAPVPPATTGNILCANPVAPATTDAYNNVFTSTTDTKREQHMTTFTLGLGMDGRVAYQKGYEKADSVGDFDRLRDGTTPTVVWPHPYSIIGDLNGDIEEARVDDLWHAAVNGHGLYFSAKKPDDIIDGFQAALDSIETQIGSGAAAATSTLNPVAGLDNLAYVASYTTVQWTGNLEARLIDATTGVVSKTAEWCVETIAAGDGVIPCTNSKMPDQAAADQASVGARKILIKDSSNNLVAFTYANLSASHKPYFEETWLSTHLSQWADLPFSIAQKAVAVENNLVNYLRGHKTNDFDAVDPNNAVFRTRLATLGDAVESQPAYISKPTFNYIDAGYSTFKTDNASRAATVYMGANDGMLHAFNGTNSADGGKERWAYVPSMVIPNMPALASQDYSTNHAYYVNGSPIISDVNIGGTWKTILVGGLNGGGRGYYALDISDPATPTLLWEFTPSSPKGANLGYSFGNPVITKKADGTWVVLVTSGYNNIPDASPRVKNPLVNTGDGVGYLYVLDAGTGAVIGSPISTGEGSTAAPSGLAQLAAWAEEPEKNNSATFVYGGDLKGNVWRFDINAPSVTKFASLGQPITTRPELGKVLTTDGKTHRIVFVGTGKYLETADLTDASQQTLYAIKDNDVVGGSVTPTLVNPRGSGATNGTSPNRMVAQVLTASGGASRSVTTTSTSPVDFATDRGWFIDLQSGERQNVAAKLVLGTLIVPTTVPSNTVCAPGGTGWLNYFDYDTGGAVAGANGQVSTFTNSPIVGINVIYVTDATTGKKTPKVSVVTADNPTPTLQPGTPFTSTGSGFQTKRAIWRELVK